MTTHHMCQLRLQLPYCQSQKIQKLSLVAAKIKSKNGGGEELHCFIRCHAGSGFRQRRMLRKRLYWLLHLGRKHLY